MSICETCGRKNICRYVCTDSVIVCTECALYEKTKHQTNFQRISASPEALAEFLTHGGSKEVRDMWTKWLKQESE